MKLIALLCRLLWSRSYVVVTFDGGKLFVDHPSGREQQAATILKIAADRFGKPAEAA